MKDDIMRILFYLKKIEQDHPLAWADIKPEAKGLVDSLDRVLVLNDVFGACVSDFQDLEDPRVQAVLDKYQIRIEKSDNWQAQYDRVQAMVAASKAPKKEDTQ